jgi:hypothetical protein
LSDAAAGAGDYGVLGHAPSMATDARR